MSFHSFYMKTRCFFLCVTGGSTWMGKLERAFFAVGSQDCSSTHDVMVLSQA